MRQVNSMLCHRVKKNFNPISVSYHSFVSVYDLKAKGCLTIIIIYPIKIYTTFYFQIGILKPLSNTSHVSLKLETHKEGIWSKRTKSTAEVFYSSGPTKYQRLCLLNKYDDLAPSLLQN